MSVWSRISNAVRSERLNREIEEELQAHMEEAIASGRDPDEARRAFGSALRAREAGHSVRVAGWLESLLADVRFGWRQLCRNRVTSAAAVLSLALAIGACTSSFRLIDALVWRPLPIAHPERLYFLSRAGMGFDNKPGAWDSWAYPDFELLQAAARGKAQLIAVSYANRDDITYKTDLEMEKASVQHVSGNMFAAFGLQPAAGRLFSESDDHAPGAAPYAVLTYDYWTRRFARDPSVIGRTLHYDNGVYQIIGVSEKKFTGTEPGIVVDIFVPTMMDRGVTRQDRTWIRTLVLVEPGVSIESLRQMFEAIHGGFERQRLTGQTGLSPVTIQNVLRNNVRIEPAPAGISQMQKNYGRALAAIAFLVLLVLFIACANVANLMSARAAARTREMALRVSIGAGKGRLVRLVLAESVLLAVLSAAIGALFSWWSAPLVVGMINPKDNPARLILPADVRVLAFGLLLTIVVMLLFGLLPALRASSVNPAGALKTGETPVARQRLMRTMVGIQVAFCFLVVFVAGLFVASFELLSNKPTGFSADRLLLLETTSRAPQPTVYWDDVAEHLREMPGVERVSQSSWPLLKGIGWNDSISVNGGPPSIDLAYFLNVSPGWFETMKIPLLQGRDFRDSDAYPQAAVVNQTFARKFLHDEHPVGRFFEKASDDGTHQRMQVVGVVRDAYYSSILVMLPVVFVPMHSQEIAGVRDATFVVRTASSNPLALASTLRQEVTHVRAEFRVSNVRSQEELNQGQTIRERLLAMLAFFFGFVALLLAGIGLYGVLNYSVLQRRREIGIRMAIGSPRAGIVRLVTIDVCIMIALGACAGVALGLGAARSVESLFYEVNATDPIMILLPFTVVLSTACAAAIPALVRAVRIDPAEILRSE
ncbi:MAG TPA: ABC transporter permease [Terracidiphilus sp.]|nr:ABC transporter permease [Terracidiphilus sp.]